MHTALGVALCSIVVAPFFGRWRANVWLHQRASALEAAHTQARSVRNNVIEIA